MANEMENAIKGNKKLDIRAVAVAGDAALAAAILGNTEPANTVTVADDEGRYTGTNVEACLAEIAGAGRTTETVKGNNTLVTDHIADTTGAHAATAISVDATTITAIQVDAAFDELAGAGRTTESVKGNADAISSLATGVNANAIHSVGTKDAAATLAVAEMGDGAIHKTIITLTAHEMTVTDGATPATDGAWGTSLLYTFPKGYIKLLGAKAGFVAGNIAASSTGSGLTETADFELGVGTVASANDTSFGLGDGTQENIVAALDIDLVASVSDADENGFNVTDVAFDGTTTAIPVNLNMRTLDDEDSATDTSKLTVTGQIVLIWTNIGQDEVT